MLAALSSPQKNQGSVPIPRITGVWECVLNSAPTTATVPTLRSAATTVVVISAPRCTQVRGHSSNPPLLAKTRRITIVLVPRS